MSAIDALWHLSGLWLPALLTGALAGAAAKLLWRSELRGVPWMRLALWSAAAGALALLGALVAFGRDGLMLSYALMLVAASLALWWAGWMQPRR